MGECVSGHEIEIEGETYHVEPLHNKPYLIDACCELINLEWKRSLAARKRSIEGSRENFPMSLLLLKRAGVFKVVGHCKISRLPFSNTEVFVETVVIHPKLRGKGLGKFLMKEVEEVAKRKKIQWIYLSTQGQEEFYAKLGYSQCRPISLCRSNLSNKTEEENLKVEDQIEQKIYWMPSLLSKVLPESLISSPPPPPAPSLPKQVFSSNAPNSKTFMKKEITI